MSMHALRPTELSDYTDDLMVYTVLSNGFFQVIKSEIDLVNPATNACTVNE